ncbi:hypothetical protein G9A89_022360 [Geosiphon pyriformis]|nr:hypothetical protein G9A89_022360 [Geosiphon pyriformis]
MEDESLVVIFLFEIKELTETSLFSGATLEEKPITAMYIDAKINALVGNDWLFKTHVILDWNTQELQFSQNGQYTCVPATCGHFKPITMPSAPFIEFEEEKKKPT